MLSEEGGRAVSREASAWGAGVPTEQSPSGHFPSPATVSSSASPEIALLRKLDSVELSMWMWATEQKVFHLLPDRPLTGSGYRGREIRSVHDTNCFSFQTLWWYFLAQDFHDC